jgi:hypothetical protein
VLGETVFEQEDEPEHEHDLGRDPGIPSSPSLRGGPRRGLGPDQALARRRGELTVPIRCAEDVCIRREHHIVESLGEHGRCEECDCP